jgi:hypothetical protein
MAIKKDPEIQENSDRGPQNQSNPQPPGIINQPNDEIKQNESDSIKNASAAGLGAIGRNDQQENSNSGW